ncbi:cytosolic phospholipase A2 gamma-like isoform X2 [Lepisosteus oculatus]|uniref:cytosolic phospholipase A2 gamma-like isoform X2 n=1 Tax=Lepisosteus oculatus TaxID=7918 RepID=UPI0035F529F9
MICVEQLDYISLLRYIRDRSSEASKQHTFFKNNMELLTAMRRETTPIENASYIRVAHTLCEGESKAIKKRKLKIQKALSSLQIVCDEACVPPIAVLGSGGGLRAMVALTGTLTELGAQNLLDTIMYLCGVSGSTWCMSSLYRDPQWSSHVEEAETKMVETLSMDNFSFLKMRQKLHEATEDEKFSLTDVWAAGFVYKVVKEMDDRKLSKEEDVDMTNPYPIYAAVDKSQMKKEKHNKGIWFEITRHEAGYPEYGAFVDTSVLGSQFSGGNKIKHKDEMDILYLQGLCGSAIGDMEQNIKVVKDTIFSFLSFHSETRVMARTRCAEIPAGKRCKCKRCSTLLCLLDLHENLYCGKDCKPILNSMKIIFKDEKVVYELISQLYDTWDTDGKDVQQMKISALSDIIFQLFQATADTHLEGITLPSNPESRVLPFFNFNAHAKLLKASSSWTWGSRYNFLYKHPNTDNSLPSELLSEDTIYLLDAGLSINSAYPLVLRRDRGVQLILSFDFSAGDPFLVRKRSKR